MHMDLLNSSQTRRQFCQGSVPLLASSLIVTDSLRGSSSSALSIPLGFDNFSIRSLGWKAPQLLKYASSQKLDSILFSDLEVYESLDSSYLKEIKQEAQNQGIVIHTGTGGICPTSKSFKDKYGTAEEHLRLLIRVAKEVGSSVARCYLGTMKDRYTQGGIQNHITSTVQVLKKIKTVALNAGVKIAVENHAGDLHSRELIELIERAGTDYAGATLDSGNATWTLEDPVDTLRNLAPYALSSGIRDSMLWKSKRGVKVQWTAMGEGCTDLHTFVSEWKRLCPALPMQLEIISGFAKEFPYLESTFWPPYSTFLAKDFSRFLLISQKGKEIKPFISPDGVEKKVAQQNYQLSQLEKSISYCRNKLSLGLQ